MDIICDRNKLRSSMIVESLDGVNTKGEDNLIMVYILSTISLENNHIMRMSYFQCVTWRHVETSHILIKIKQMSSRPRF